MPTHPSLRHFKNGISSVSQWTGREHKEMEKVFIGVLAGAADDSRVIKAASALLDFIYIASFQTHTTQTIKALESALDTFHENKQVFVDLEARNPGHFNIPKVHSLEHYVDAIKRFGSLDGYNTESPERLHIDYAKDAYRATNKRDYIIQMVTWLRRQEAIDRFSLYLNWRVQDRGSGGDSSSPQDVLDPGTQDSDELGSVTLVPPPSARVNSTGQSALGLIPIISHASSDPLLTASSVSRQHPPHLKRVSADCIINEQNASQFLPALRTYLQQQGSWVIPFPHDTFDLFRQIVIQLPVIPEANRKTTRDIIRSTPPIPARGRVAAKAAQSDFALIRTNTRNPDTDATALQGLQVGHVRVIFALPLHFRVFSLHPLAYVEWCTPFRASDPTNGLFSVSHSTRMGHPNAEVMPINRIVRSCHLIPLYGRAKDPQWTSENVRDLCRTFLVNAYFDVHSFTLFKAGVLRFTNSIHVPSQ